MKQSRIINSGAPNLYHLVTDVSRVPEWLPGVRSVGWNESQSAIAPSARFEVRLRSGWRRTRTFEVVLADVGRTFTFVEVTRRGYRTGPEWSLSFTDAPGGGTELSCSVDAGVEHGRRIEAIIGQLLEGIASTAEGRARVPQPRLGQVHTAEGPLDLSAMFVMHHGFRRDLRDFAAAVPETPVDAADVWRELERRWGGMSRALHHHHQVEDDALWPLLVERVRAAGDRDALMALEAMSAEHSTLDPLVEACSKAFRAMVEAPDVEVRERLAADLDATRGVLLEHLAHEEVAALPVAQAHMSVAMWDDFERASRKEYGLADITFAVPWSVLEIPDDQFEIAYAHGGALVRAILAVTRPRFVRAHRIAFRHLPPQPTASLESKVSEPCAS